MSGAVNPLLQQVLHRRRILRRVRLSVLAWIVFAGLHIALWWAAFEQHSFSFPDALGGFVWPLLLAATVSLVAVIVNLGRWFLAPGSPQDYTWLERSADAVAAPEPVGAESSATR